VTSDRLRSLLVRVGGKPGAKAQLGILLGPEDLPAGPWRVVRQRTWRTGAGGSQDWAARARAAGCLTAWRSFEDSDVTRELWVQAAALASADDAANALQEDSVAQFIAELKAKRQWRSDAVVSPPPLPGAAASWAREVTTKLGPGVAENFLLAAAFDSSVIALGASGRPGTWTWKKVANLALAQGRRVGSPT
jgi:hypothetical protein